MNAPVNPRLADWIRKIVAYSVAGVGTWLLLRVLFRLANGKAYLADPELWIVLVLGAGMTAWVMAAKPVRRRARDPDETEPTPPPS